MNSPFEGGWGDVRLLVVNNLKDMIRSKYIKLLLVFVFVATTNKISGQSVTNNLSRRDYIREYSTMAISEMQKSGIPASITLAQGILESGSGKSSLAMKANNHFGIKCHEGWDGEYVLFDDDRKNECFRSYETIEESFLDHTDFLVNRQRYAFLFAYNRTDYKAWAKGLRTAGYATNPEYDKMLIRIIEENQLFLFDRGQTELALAVQEDIVDEIIVSRTNIINAFGRQILSRNRVNYIVAGKSDNFEKLTDQLDLFSWQLKKYNELSDPKNIEEGEIIYIESKKLKADKRFEYHLVQENETMYSISQEYGIRLNRLYWLNRMSKDNKPGVNAKLNLRKRIKKQKFQQDV